MQILDDLFEQIYKAGFRLNKDKCQFLTESITHLGHDLSNAIVRMTKNTKNAIDAFERPRNVKQTQKFLGFVNWDRRFVLRLSELTRPLEEFLKQDERFKWIPERQREFKQIKVTFARMSVLHLKAGITIWSRNGCFHYRSGRKTISIPARRPEHGVYRGIRVPHPQPREKYYTVTELEGFPLHWALKKFHLLIYGQSVRVKTDHVVLRFLSACSKNSSRIARWMRYFGNFDLQVEHIPSTHNLIADTLSRNPTQLREVNNAKAGELKIIVHAKKREDARQTNGHTGPPKCDTSRKIQSNTGLQTCVSPNDEIIARRNPKKQFRNKCKKRDETKTIQRYKGCQTRVTPSEDNKARLHPTKQLYDNGKKCHINNK